MGDIVYINWEKLIVIAVSLSAAVIQFFVYMLPALQPRELLSPLKYLISLSPSVTMSVNLNHP